MPSPYYRSDLQGGSTLLKSGCAHETQMMSDHDWTQSQFPGELCWVYGLPTAHSASEHGKKFRLPNKSIMPWIIVLMLYNDIGCMVTAERYFIRNYLLFNSLHVDKTEWMGIPSANPGDFEAILGPYQYYIDFTPCSRGGPTNLLKLWRCAGRYPESQRRFFQSDLRDSNHCQSGDPENGRVCW